MTAPTILELDTGQLAIASDVVERNGQQAFTELARPAQPAPVAEELARPADDELRRRQQIEEELRRESHERVAPWTPEELETLREGAQEADEELVRRSRKPARREYDCGDCGRRLPHERWIYSRHTGARYCTPGEGCNTPAAYARKERDRARARARREEAA